MTSGDGRVARGATVLKVVKEGNVDRVLAQVAYPEDKLWLFTFCCAPQTFRRWDNVPIWVFPKTQEAELRDTSVRRQPPYRRMMEPQ